MSDRYLPDNEPRDILLSLEELAVKKMPHAPTFRKAADEITRLRADIAAVTAERDRLREALEFYGWAEHWVKQPYERSVIEDDRGRRARAALEGVTEPASPWRDIESAPKDQIILVYDTSTNPEIVAALLSDGGWFYADKLLAEADPEGPIPTHWMPLPEPPR